jgi:glycine hydroxymethyltransferase
MVTSGLRIGTPALATRGFDESAFAEVSDIVATALLPDFDDAVEAALQARVRALAAAYPLYPDLH